MSRSVVMANWDDVPHLSRADKDELYAAIPPYQRGARAGGIPQLGSGAIYPLPENEITVDDFPIPKHWPATYSMDVGWNKTAALWQAWDRDEDTWEPEWNVGTEIIKNWRMPVLAEGKKKMKVGVVDVDSGAE